jgi:5-methylcytosine-specific restriction endonuclease McrA
MKKTFRTCSRCKNEFISGKYKRCLKCRLRHRVNSELWRLNNVEKCRAASCRHYYNNKEEVLAQHKSYRKKNPEKGRETKRHWRANNKEYLKWYHSNYAKKHAEKHRQTQAKRRAIKKGATIGVVDFEFVKTRDKMVCHICGRKVELVDLNFDHLVPLSRGGTHCNENIFVSHEVCNKRKYVSVIRSNERTSRGD